MHGHPEGGTGTPSCRPRSPPRRRRCSNHGQRAGYAATAAAAAARDNHHRRQRAFYCRDHHRRHRLLRPRFILCPRGPVASQLRCHGRCQRRRMAGVHQTAPHAGARPGGVGRAPGRAVCADQEAQERRRAGVRRVPHRVRRRRRAPSAAAVLPRVPPGVHQPLARGSRHLPAVPRQPREARTAADGVAASFAREGAAADARGHLRSGGCGGRRGEEGGGCGAREAAMCPARGEDATVALDLRDGRGRDGRPREIHRAAAAARPGGGAQVEAAAARDQPRHHPGRRRRLGLPGELDGVLGWWREVRATPLGVPLVQDGVVVVGTGRRGSVVREERRGTGGRRHETTTVRPCGVLLGGSVAGPVQSQDFAMSFFFFLVSLFYLFFLFFFFSECQIDCEWFDFVKKTWEPIARTA